MYEVSLSPRLEVKRNGAPVGAPPTKSVGELVRLLATTFPRATERKAAALRLYAGSTDAKALNALRQTVHRLRVWLGPDALTADYRYIGLATDRWVVNRTDSPTEPPEAQVPPGEAVAASFRDLLINLAGLDPEEARAMLSNGRVILDSLPIGVLIGLLKQTAPHSARDHFAYEHLAATARYHHRTCQFSKSLSAHQRVFRFAEQNRRYSLGSLAASWILFNLVEMGDMASAMDWLPTVVGSDRTNAGKLFAANARACFMWNGMDLEGAGEQFGRASRLIHLASRTDQAHYWSNYAVFLAEAGMFGEAPNAIAKAWDLIIPGLDAISVTSTCLAQALVAKGNGDLDHAAHILSKTRAEEASRGQTLSVCYCAELESEVLAMQGKKQQALRLWEMAERKRLVGGGSLTPRLQGYKARVEALTAGIT